MDFGSFLRIQKTAGAAVAGGRGRGRGMLPYYDVRADPAQSRHWGHERGDYSSRGRGFNRAQPRGGHFVRGNRGHHLQHRHNYENNNAYYEMQYGDSLEYSEDRLRESGEQYTGVDYGDPALNTNTRNQYKNYEGDFTQPVDQHIKNKVQHGDLYKNNKGQYGDQYGDNEGPWGDQYGDKNGQYGVHYGDSEDQFGDQYGDGEVPKGDQQGDTEGHDTMDTEERLQNSERSVDDFQSSSNKVQPTTREHEPGDKTKNNQAVKEDECEEDLEKSDEEKDETTKAIEKLPVRHQRGLMSTLIGLAGPEVQNRKPDPLPRPQPMKLVDDKTMYLSTNKQNVCKIDDTALLEYGITQNMLDEANLEIDDTPANERDLLPNEIGKEINKEFFCKLCHVQTTSMGNFRDHLNGKGHKAVSIYQNTLRNKKTAVISSEVLGKKSVTVEMVEGVIEPILGLSYITEYHSQSGIINVCNLCGVKFDRNIVVSHVTGTKHRLHYMKENRPSVYVHLKKFGGKKSQLSAFLDELSLDAEREDGRGVPSIKVFEQPDHDDEEDASVIEISLNEADDEETKEKKQKEAMLARRKPGNISFQDWVNEEINKSKSKGAEKVKNYEEEDSSNSSHFKFGAGSSGPPVNKSMGVQPHSLHPDFPIKQKSQHGPIPMFDPLLHNLPRHPHHLPHFSHADDHLPHRYRLEPFLPRMDPYFDPLFNPLFDPYRSDPQLYHDRPLLPPSSRSQPYLGLDPLKQSLGRGYPPGDPYFDPNPLKSGRNFEPFLDPDPTKRVRNSEPYLDPDPTKRVRNSESYLDPDPTKRVRNSEPYLDPDPTKRVRISEPYLDPDPLKRLPPKKTVPTPVVFDYGHGSGDKNDTTPHKSSVQKTADKWEDDIQQILGTDTNKAPNSLAILSSNYSSPERSPPPVPGKKPRMTDKPLPFSRSYLETHLPLNIPKVTGPKKPEKISDYKSGLGPSSSNKGYIEKDLNDPKPSSSQEHRSRHKSQTHGPEHDKQSTYQEHYSRHKSQTRSPEHDKNRRSRTPDHLKGNILRSSISISSRIFTLEAHKYSDSPKHSSKRRHSKSPVDSSSNKARCPNASHLSKSTDRSRMSPSSKKHQKSFESQSLGRTQADTKKEMQDILSEADEEAQAEKIANLLLQMSGSLSEAGDAQSALRKLFANSDLTEALFAAKTNSDEVIQKRLTSHGKPDPPSQPHRQTKGNASQTQPPPRRERVTFSLPVSSKGQNFRSTLPSDFAADEDTE
ncbi:unnamed protein product [Lymnaea stagnalis]|uniref:C2H2-type domain-containing protein n=1 Tax=Lymnaea stagnalis TaxID=6523 RepID=A0AAV2HA64_LYMST